MEENSLPALVQASETFTSGDWEYKANGDIYEICGYKGSSSEITIPAELNGTVIQAIAPLTFADNTTIQKVIISEGIKKIGRSAFYRCTGLTTLKLPSTLEECVFDAGRVELGDGKTTIETGPFGGCSSLKDVDITALKTIPANLFLACTGIEEITIPEAVTEIGNKAFDCAVKLKKVDFGKSLTRIGSDAFLACFSLEEAILPDTLKTIDMHAFVRCTSLKKLHLPAALEKAGYSSLAIDVGAEEKLVSGPFGGCTSLTAIEFGNGIKTIPAYLFSGCWTLTDKEMPAIPSTVTAICANAYASTAITEMSVPDSVVEIKEYAFTGCKKLQKISVPKSVAKIGKGVFNGCDQALEIYGPAGSSAEKYATENNIKFVAGNFNETYTITYNLKTTDTVENPNPSVYSASDGLVLAPAAREGYKFSGWYTKSDCKSGKISEIKKGAKGNKKLYAKWTAKKYTIEYDANPTGIKEAPVVDTSGASGKTAATKNVAVGKKGTLRANGFQYKGYKFIGWNTSADGNGDPYKNQAKVINLSFVDGKFSDTVTLYAQWQEVTYKISYKSSKGKMTLPDDTVKKFTISQDVTLPTPTRNGYQFDGWYTKKNGKGKQITSIEKGSTTKNLTLYAKWVKE